MSRKSRRNRANKHLSRQAPPDSAINIELRAQQRCLLQLRGELRDLAEELSAVRLDRDRWIARTRMLQGQIEYAFLREHAAVADARPSASSNLEAYWLSYFPDDLWVDLREIQLGDNWYPPEADGRWMGSGHSAQITLMRMPPGAYRVEFEIVGAMFNPMEFPISLRIFSKIISVEISPLDKGASFPFLLHGSVTLTAEESEFPVELTVIPPTKFKRAAEAMFDERELSVRFRMLRFLRNISADAANV